MKRIYPILPFCLSLFTILGLWHAQPPVQSFAVGADRGVIAYVHPDDATGDEIHLIDPDGMNDMAIWYTGTRGLATGPDVAQLTWKPDASELAFWSRFQEQCSFYNGDIFAIQADGAGLRRVTAPPACGQIAGLPTGTVRVAIENGSASSGPFVVYFEGAPGPKLITLAPNNGTVVTFSGVADFGSRKQWAVVVDGENRYTAFEGNADVIPGAAVDTGGAVYISYATTDWGWTWPTWKGDGSQISFIFASAAPYTVAANNSVPGYAGSKLFKVADEQIPYDPDFLTWAPPGPRANQLLFTGWDAGKSGDTIYLATAGSASPAAPLVYLDEGVGRLALGLAWLPDSSGFLYSKTEGYGQYANIYEYRFATGKSTRITSFSTGYPRRLSVSPDGTNVVYEYQSKGEWMENDPEIDLWVMNRNGSGKELLVQNGRDPAWSLRTPPQLQVLDKKISLPAILK